MERLRRPTHPGAILREDVLPGLGITVPHFAHRLGVPTTMLEGVLAELVDVTPRFAALLGQVLDTTAESWMNMQKAYDAWETRP